MGLLGDWLGWCMRAIVINSIRLDSIDLHLINRSSTSPNHNPANLATKPSTTDPHTHPTHHSNAATNGVVIATEKKLPSVLIDEAHVQKVELINPSTGPFMRTCDELGGVCVDVGGGPKKSLIIH